MMRMRYILTAILLSAAMAAAGGGLPRVMTLVDEKSLGTIATSEIENMAMGMLMKQGFSVVDQDMVRANLQKSQQLLKSVGDARGAAALGMEFGADVIITGEAVAKPSPRRIAGSNFRAYQAVVTLKAIRTDNAQALATASESASIAGLDDVEGGAKALKAAGDKTLKTLIPDLMESWKRSGAVAGAGARRQVILTVGGVDQIWKLRAVREQLRSLDDIAGDVTQRSYSAGAAIYEVSTPRPVEEFAEELVMHPPEGLKFQVLNITPGKVDLNVVDAP